MRSVTGQKRGQLKSSASVLRETKVPSTQSAVRRRRRPLKLTQPSEGRQSPEADCSVASACDLPPATSRSNHPGRCRSSGDLVPGPIQPALPSPLPSSFHRLVPQASPGRSGTDAHIRLSQDAERVYWDPSRPSSQVPAHGSESQATMETAVVRSSVRCCQSRLFGAAAWNGPLQRGFLLRQRSCCVASMSYLLAYSRCVMWLRTDSGARTASRRIV